MFGHDTKESLPISQEKTPHVPKSEGTSYKWVQKENCIPTFWGRFQTDISRWK